MTFRSSIPMLILAGALAAPAVTFGQQPDTTSRTHVVRQGETLWSLARTYLGNPRRWREIMAANPALIPSADSLPVGKTIRIPGSGPASRAANRAPVRAPAAQPPSARLPIPRPTAPPIRPPVSTVRDTTPPRRRVGDRAAQPQPTPRSDTTRVRPAVGPQPEHTVFYGNQPGGGPRTVPRGASQADTGRSRASIAPRSSPNVFEVISAPFVADPARLRGAGNFANGGASLSLGSMSGRRTLTFGDTVLVRPPRGVAIDSGSRIVVARVGPTISGLGTVVVPTGVVRASGRIDAHGMVRGIVVAQFDAMTSGDVVLRYPDVPAPSPDSLVPVARGARGRIVWVTGEAQLPSVQERVIVDVGSGDGVHPGDQLTIRGVLDGASADFARARVLRVGVHDATAIIVQTSQPRLRDGMTVVLTATLP